MSHHLGGSFPASECHPWVRFLQPILSAKIKGGSLRCCCKEAVRSSALPRTACMWHSGHHCQLHGNFAAGASGVSAKLGFAGFSSTAVPCGDNRGRGDGSFLKKIFIGEEKKIQKEGELPLSTGDGMAKAEGLRPQHGHTWLEVTEKRHSCFSG